jgi:prepilin-type N-terminal cleavage/methylation domain-containing protein
VTAAPSDREDGFTLIELLMSIMILGLVFVAILGAMAATVMASDVHRKQATTDAVAVSAAERLKSRDLLYVGCALKTDASYLVAARSAVVPSGWDPVATISISDISYETRDAAGASFGSTCYDANGIKIQKITVAVTSPDGRTSASVVLVKNGDV